MGMPPESPPLAVKAKFVCKTVSGRNTALGNANDAVHPCRISLVDAMPVDSCAPVGHEIVDMDSDFEKRSSVSKFAFAYFNHGSPMA